MKKSGKKKEPDGIDEVEELLKLTQDDLLLKLTVNSHNKSTPTSKFDFIPESSCHSNAIDPDLDRRFQALRSKPKTQNNEDVDSLFARFAALKPPPPPPNATSTTEDLKIDVEEADEEDEVQKIINWAVDAARLDPSPSSDIDDDLDTESDEDSDASVAPKNKNKGSKK